MSYINESVIYNIYPLGFCGAPKENDGQLVYRLDKLYNWIEHLKSMSINAIVFNPVFESSRHGYDTIDYKKIDCRLGDNESFKKLCKTLRDNNIRVILDGVFNHVGRDFFAFKDVQQKKWDSPYCGWFQNINFNERSPYGDPFRYDGWSGHYDLVKLNLNNQDVVNYLLGAVELWIDEFGIEGLRLDAADCVDLGFFKRLRNLCKSKNPDFWLYGEIIHGDYNRWANSETLDSVTNYECYKGIYSSHNDHNYFEIAHSFNRQFANGGIYRNIYTYNFVDNHDVNRIASVLKDKNHLNNIYTMMYTMPGVPSIYYGSEFGIEGTRTQHCDYDLRPCIELDSINNPNLKLLEHIKKLGKVRLALEALKYGDFANVNIQNEKLVYKRWTNNQTVFIVFNLTNHDDSIGFNTDCNAKLVDVLNDNEIFDTNGYVNINMKPYSTRILVVSDGSFKLDLDETYDTYRVVKNNTPETIEKENVFETNVVIGKKYRHFKGDIYKVTNIATHSETEEKLVIYQNINDESSVWARPYNMFIEVIDYSGKKIQRFAPIE